MKYVPALLAVIISAVILVSVHQNIKNYTEQVSMSQVQGKIQQFDHKEFNCIRQALWHEARGEGPEGIKAVAAVINNRVNAKGYPGTYCEVIHQPKQFSYVHERLSAGKSLSIDPKESEHGILEVIDNTAEAMLTGQFTSPLKSSVLWYHAHYVKPRWAKVKQRAAKIGNHIFYEKREDK